MRTANQILKDSGLTMKDLLSEGGVEKIEQLIQDGINEGCGAQSWEQTMNKQHQKELIEGMAKQISSSGPTKMNQK